MTVTCPNCQEPTDHTISTNPAMYGCLTETCRVCSFFPDKD